MYTLLQSYFLDALVPMFFTKIICFIHYISDKWLCLLTTTKKQTKIHRTYILNTRKVVPSLALLFLGPVVQTLCFDFWHDKGLSYFKFFFWKKPTGWEPSGWKPTGWERTESTRNQLKPMKPMKPMKPSPRRSPPLIRHFYWLSGGYRNQQHTNIVSSYGREIYEAERF